MSVPEQPPQGSTRERIVATAARLFAERGYAATSVREISAEVGISVPALYHHFRTKGSLLHEALAAPMTTVATAVAEAEALPEGQRARRVVTGLLDALLVHSGVVAAVVVDQAAAAQLRDFPALRAVEPTVLEVLARYAAGPDPALRARMTMGAVQAAVVGLAADATGSPDGFGEVLRRRRDEVADLALELLRG